MSRLLEQRACRLHYAWGALLRRMYMRTLTILFPRSAMDGYAVKSRDTKEASQQNPAVLGVIDRVCAGEVSGKTLSDGQAVRIMTGAAIPKGADCVIRQEDTDYGKNR